MHTTHQAGALQAAISGFSPMWPMLSRINTKCIDHLYIAEPCMSRSCTPCSSKSVDGCGGGNLGRIKRAGPASQGRECKIPLANDAAACHRPSISVDSCSMNIGLVGLAKSGKTTIFNALTGENAEVSAYQSGKVQPNRAVVRVSDSRVDNLSAMYNPKKTVYAQLELVDFAGLAAGADNGEVFSGEALASLKNCDVLTLVLRNFDDAATPGVPDPAGDLSTLLDEFLLSDQILLERRLERVREDMQKGKRNPDLPAEEKLLSMVHQRVEAGEPIRSIELNADQLKRLSGYAFITAKPFFAILNSGEEAYGNSRQILDAIEDECPVVEFAGKFEMELAGLDPDEAEDFMGELGITESARERLTGFAYSILGYSSFFTVGPDEVRAWTIRKGASAVDAAGVIHSDLARGFIRAECFTYADIEAHGSEKELKGKGLIRLEGKEYQVADGDILNIRFSV